MPEGERINKYRNRAVRFREEAAKTSSPDIRALLLELADQYDLLAQSMEQQAKRRMRWA
ncbi:MAG: hypothetical protein QOK29_3678 [Rhodospirillaceae bacterium]|jgi:hypothetical protein|nr:hypothetical protein [Rhodospirillaceae bacterium]